MSNRDNETVTLTLTRRQAKDLRYILERVYDSGVHEPYHRALGANPPKAPEFKGDKEVRAAARAFESLTDNRRKSIALNFRNDQYQ